MVDGDLIVWVGEKVLEHGELGLDALGMRAVDLTRCTAPSGEAGSAVEAPRPDALGMVDDGRPLAKKVDQHLLHTEFAAGQQVVDVDLLR